MDARKLRAEGQKLLQDAIKAADKGDAEKAKALLLRGQMRLEAASVLQNQQTNITIAGMDPSVLRSVSRFHDHEHSPGAVAYIRALQEAGYTLTTAAQAATKLALERGQPGGKVTQGHLSLALRKLRGLGAAKRASLEAATGVPFPTKL